MNSKFDLIFISFVVNIISVFNVFVVYPNRLDSLVYYNDSAISHLQLTSKDIFNLHHSFVIEDLKWENGEINFRIDKSFTDDEIEKILKAMHEIESLSCIQFVPYDPCNGPDYVMIRKDYSRSGSSAHLGCLYGGEQNLSLSVEMIDEHQTILHELLHTIGFGHHHQRSDRDKYIEIHLGNTNLSDSDVRIEYATDVKPDDRVTYLTPFDFNSVMMYDDDEYSVNGRPVLTSKIEGKQVPSFRDRNRGLSKFDIILLNRFYDCHMHKKKSKFFNEDDKAIPYPKNVNYNEIQRAKDYLVDNDLERVEQYQPDIDTTKALLRETLLKSRKSILPPELLEETDQFDQQYERHNHYGDDEDLIDRQVTYEANTNSANSVPYDQIPSVDKQLHEERQKEQMANIDFYPRLMEFYAEIRSLLHRLKRFFEENEQLELVDTNEENENGVQEDNESGVQEENELNVQEDNENDVQGDNKDDVQKKNESDVQEGNKDNVQEDNELDIDIQEDNENDVQEDNKDVVQEKSEGDVQQENEDDVQCAISGASRLSFNNLQMPWL